MKKMTVWMIGIFLTSVFLFGYTNPTQAEEIKIGALSDITGPTAAGGDVLTHHHEQRQWVIL